MAKVFVSTAERKRRCAVFGCIIKRGDVCIETYAAQQVCSICIDCARNLVLDAEEKRQRCRKTEEIPFDN